LLVPIVLFVFSSGVAAQTIARIDCRVVDQNNKPVAGATVKITSPDRTSFEQIKTTKKKGRCIFTLDYPMNYLVEVEAEGFAHAEKVVALTKAETLKETIELIPEGLQADTSKSMTTEEIQEAQILNEKVKIYNDGVDALKAGDLDSAVEKFTQVSAMDPAFVPALVGIAVIEEERGNYELAVSAAEKALAVDPKDFRALQVRFDAYDKLGDAKNAEKAAKALRDAGDVAHAVDRIFREGVAAFNSKDIETAKARFRDALSLDPELVEGYANLARIYLAEENLAVAGEMAAETLKRRPGDVTMLKIQYDALSRQGKTAEAEAVLSELVVADPTWAGNELFTLAGNLFNAGRIEQAQTALESLLGVHPDHPDAHYLLALCLNSSGDTATAKTHLERFLEIAPDHQHSASAREILSYLQ
jgi:tetratricopeptide (TPR) repeat protein